MILLLVGFIGALLLRQTVFDDDDSTADETLEIVGAGESFELGPNDVVMEPANNIGADSFSAEPLAAEIPAEVTAPSGATAPGTTPTTLDSSGAVIVNATPAPAQGVNGRRPGLYGGTNDDTKCDAVAMIAFLMAPENRDKAEAWVKAQNADPRIIQQFGREMVVADLPQYIGELTPVVLQADTRTTNHGFKNGTSNQKQAVLQKGTAVLVDKEGVVRARCLCGNPQIPPVPTPDVPRYVKIPIIPRAVSDVPPTTVLTSGETTVPPAGSVPEPPPCRGDGCPFPYEDDYEVPEDPVGAPPPDEPIPFTLWPETPAIEASPPGDPDGPITPLEPLVVLFCGEPAAAQACIFDPQTYGLTPPPYGPDLPPPAETVPATAPAETAAPETTTPPDTTTPPATTVAPTTVPPTTAAVGSPPVLEVVSAEVLGPDGSQGCGEGARFAMFELAYSDPDGDATQDLYVNGDDNPKDPQFIESVSGDGSSGTISVNECALLGVLTYEIRDAAGNFSNLVEVPIS